MIHYVEEIVHFVEMELLMKVKNVMMETILNTMNVKMIVRYSHAHQFLKMLLEHVVEKVGNVMNVFVIGVMAHGGDLILLVKL